MPVQHQKIQLEAERVLSVVLLSLFMIVPKEVLAYISCCSHHILNPPVHTRTSMPTNVTPHHRGFHGNITHPGHITRRVSSKAMEWLLRREGKHLFHLLKYSLHVLQCQSIHCSSGSIFVQRVWSTVPKQKHTFLTSLRPSTQDWEDLKKESQNLSQRSRIPFVAGVPPHLKIFLVPHIS